jgi:hypothetical protein
MDFVMSVGTSTQPSFREGTGGPNVVEIEQNKKKSSSAQLAAA